MAINHKPFWATNRHSHNAFGNPTEEVDIAIIGGGLKGLATMYFLSSLGLRCMLLERGTVGCGESSRNIGAICTVPDCSPNMFEDDVILQRISMAEKNRKMLTAVIDEVGFDIDLVCNGGLHLAANDAQIAQLEVLHGLLAKNNIVCDELDSKQVTNLVAGHKFIAGLYYPSEATLHPAKLLDLLTLLNAAFVKNTVVEYFNVVSIEETDNSVEILSDRGTHVRSSVAVICTDQLSYFYKNSSILQGDDVLSLCFASEPIDKILVKMPMSSRTVTGMQAWTIHDGRIIYSFRNRVGTGDNFGYNEDDIRKSQRFLVNYIPASKGHYHQEYMWSSNYKKTTNLLPFIDFVPGSNKIIANIGYGYSILDLFLKGAEIAAECTTKALNNKPLGGAESAESSTIGDS